MALRNTVEEMVNHRGGGGGSVVASHRGGGGNSVVVTTLRHSMAVFVKVMCVDHIVFCVTFR